MITTRCPQGSDSPFALRAEVFRHQLSGAGITEIVDRDIIFETAAGVSFIERALITVDRITDFASPKFSSSPNAFIDSSGLLTVNSPATVSAFVEYGKIVRKLRVSLAGEVGTVNSVSRYVPGSLGAHCCASIDPLLIGKTEASLPLFAIQQHETPSYQRSTNFWGASLADKLTCISPWNSMSGSTRAGVAITPRHILFAHHFPVYNGTVFRFITANNTIVERTMITAIGQTDGAGYGKDMEIGVLDSNLPASIVPCKTLPTNIMDYFGFIYYEDGEFFIRTFRLPLPCLTLDQYELGSVMNWVDEQRIGVGNKTNRCWPPPTQPNRARLYRDKLTGDSGNPAFIVVNGNLVVILCWTGQFTGTTTAQPALMNDMITVVDGLAGVSTGYTVTPINLTGFPTYV